MRKDFIEVVKERFTSEKVSLLDEITEDTNSKKDYIRFKCLECGDEDKIVIKNLMDPRRLKRLCTRCHLEDNFKNKLIDLYGRNPYIFKTRFIGYNEPLTVKCIDCGDEFTMPKARALLMNSKLPEGQHPCKKCTTIRRNETKDINELIETLRKKFGDCNYEFPKPESYAGLYSKTPFNIKCKFCGHETSTVIINILEPSNGKHYCRVCNNRDRLLEKMSYKERCITVTEGKIEPIEEYIDSKTPIKHKCNICGYGKNGEWLKIPVKNTKRNAGCPSCAGNITKSSAEDEIYKYIQTIYTGKIDLKNRDVLDDKKELDIYVPDLKVAFEINGLYWHSEKYKGKKYHIEKTLSAKEKGVRLVHILEDEWYQKPEICKDKIANILGVTTNRKIYARKCSISTSLKSTEKNKFLEKYHIQGGDHASITVSLVYDKETVAVMTFAKPRLSLGRKEAVDGEYELSRFASSCNVVGGFSKLLKYAVDTYNIKCINTYADIRWSSLDKNVYVVNGFKEVRRASPGYWYFNKNEPSRSVKRLHRFGFRKQELKKRFPDQYDDKLTEFEIMDQTEYCRIWDCGNIVYRWEK